MKVHFVGPLDGNKEDYRKIFKVIEGEGWEIVTKHSLERSLSDVEGESSDEAKEYFESMRIWIRQADVVLIESTQSVFGAGFETAIANSMNKPAVVLYRDMGNNTPHVIKGVETDKLQVVAYNDENLQELLVTAIEYALSAVDTRFNFFITPRHVSYLDWIAKNKRIPRSVYLRNLILSDRESNSDYLG